MQQNALMYGLGGLIVIAGGVGLWMYTAGMSAPQEAAVADIQQNAQPEVQVEHTSLTSLLATSGSRQCTFESSTPNSTSSGTVYIADGRMRGDFTSSASGATVESHMIVENDTSYVWSSAMPQGVTLPLASMSAQGGASESIDPNAQIDYTCDAWNTDEHMFTLPADVTFQDLSSFMPGTF